MHLQTGAKRLVNMRYAGYLLILALCILMFGDLLLAGQGGVLGDHSRDSSTDMFHEFLALRAFGFEQLALGHLALWNPHVFSGAPFFGSFQPALLYPPNWVFLVLPLASAINASIALHVFLMGAFMNAWALRRGLHPGASALAGILMMFGGPFFLQIYAGHLTNLCAMVWVPLIFMTIDALTPLPDSHAPSTAHQLKWALFGAAAVSMQILAGHPQYVYYTGIAGALYCGFRIPQQNHKAQVLGWLLAFAAGGALLSALQLLVGLQATSETIRSAPLTVEFASRFSLTPESLLTAIAPWIFGKLAHTQYVGRWYQWEMSLFLGVTGCTLACAASWRALRGAFKSDVQAQAGLTLLAMVLLLLLLALGSYTPAFDWLFHHMPGFNRFRGTAKFGFFACLFGSLLAAMAYDHHLKTRGSTVFAIGAAFALAAVCLGALLLTSQVDWTAHIQALHGTGQTYLPADLFSDPDSAPRRQATANFARDMVELSLFKAGALATATGVLLLLSRKKPHAVWLMGALVIAEMFVFAAQSRETMDTTDINAQQVSQFLAQHPGDYRIANASNPNAALSIGAADMLGNDSSALLRYAEFMAFAQGQSPDHANQYMNQAKPSPLYALLRLRYMFNFFANGTNQVVEATQYLPHLALVDRYRVVPERDAIFKALTADGFDPRKLVILESQPSPPPVPGAEGSVQILSETSDTLLIEADLAQAAILLVSDAYSRYWQALALPESEQREYTVQPADYVIRAIALQKGHHRFKLQYVPSALLPGIWISGLSWLVWAVLGIWVTRRKVR